MQGGDVGRNIVAGIFMILVLFWLFAPGSKAKEVIQAIGGSTSNVVNALQGYVPSGTQQVPLAKG